MDIDIRTIPQGHSELNQSTMLESVKEDLPPLSRAVKCRGYIDRNGSVLVVSFVAEAVLSLECARCLNRYDHSVEAQMRLIIRESTGKHGVAVDDEGVDFYYNVNEDLLDISPAIYDELMIAVPIKPLCRQDCKGVEVKVKKTEVNSADQENIDPRWEALRKLKHKN
ncbi:metal-binding protein [Chitinispirillum alkaliphilum]|nr:metal-binding protein [Chitinispirillum alkaliphilum]